MCWIKCELPAICSNARGRVKWIGCEAVVFGTECALIGVGKLEKSLGSMGFLVLEIEVGGGCFVNRVFRLMVGSHERTPHSKARYS